MPVGSLRYIAEQAVNRERKHGRMKPQPCAVCGHDHVVAHHEDYRKPLDVTWLCRVHHQRRHAELNLATFGRKRTGIPYSWVFEFGMDECWKRIAKADSERAEYEAMKRKRALWQKRSALRQQALCGEPVHGGDDGEPERQQREPLPRAHPATPGAV